ncbi:IclR family transcriptional regulator [Castellaniella sp.]|uniref:IclR family transcriptional regulator n=1 Tax=Castellaniella sp. TaxID=1955812 RepID=UPI00355D8454
MTKPNPAIKTARRIFEVLEYFEEIRRPVSLKEISTKFSYPGSSASALLKSMVTLGYLFYHSDTRTYMPTMRIARMGRWLETKLFGETSIMSLVEYVHARTDEVTSISTQSDLLAQYLHTIQSSQRLRFEVPPGDVRPLAISGIGRTLLSLHTDDEIDRLVRRINATLAPEHHANLETLLPVIHRIRRDGYYISRHVITPEAGIIAMPLPRRNYGRNLVLGVGGPVSRLDSKEAQIVEIMREGIRKFLENDEQTDTG